MWVETESLSFTARHEEADDESAQRTLDALEDLRLKLEDRFDVAPGDVTVVVHPSPAWLNAAHPFLPAARLAAAPGRSPLPRRLGDGTRASCPQRRLSRQARRGRGLARGAARHRRTPLCADRHRRQQPQPAAALGAAALLALPALVVAGRRWRSVLRGPGASVPARGPDPHARRQAARPSRLRRATRSSSAARSSTCSSASADAMPAASSSRAPAATGPSARSRSRSASQRTTSASSGGATCERTCRARAHRTRWTSCTGRQAWRPWGQTPRSCQVSWTAWVVGSEAVRPRSRLR